MTFLYALKCDKPAGKNPSIKDAITIQVINEFTPVIMDIPTNHGGISSGSAVAAGNFRPQFIIEDAGEIEAVTELEKAAINKMREAKSYTITRYTVQDNSPVIDTEVKYEAHYCLIDHLDSNSASKQHVFALVSAQPRSKVQHVSYKAGSNATKLATTQDTVTNLMVDQSGNGIIQNE